MYLIRKVNYKMAMRPLEISTNHLEELLKGFPSELLFKLAYRIYPIERSTNVYASLIYSIDRFARIKLTKGYHYEDLCKDLYSIIVGFDENISKVITLELIRQIYEPVKKKIEQKTVVNNISGVDKGPPPVQPSNNSGTLDAPITISNSNPSVHGSSFVPKSHNSTTQAASNKISQYNSQISSGVALNDAKSKPVYDDFFSQMQNIENISRKNKCMCGK